jgi:hypothetical protein
MVVDAGDEVLLVISGQCRSVRLLHFAAARFCRSRLRIRSQLLSAIGPIDCTAYFLTRNVNRFHSAGLKSN